MNRFFSALALLLLISLLSRCVGQQDASEYEIDENIQLESSVLGISVIAKGLDVPWEILWGPDDWIWITEQKGIISRIHPETGEKKTLLTIPGVWMQRTSGLLGMVVHPNQDEFPWVFVNYTLERAGQYFSRLERYTYQGDTLVEPRILLEIPAGTSHNGSRLSLSLDHQYLFWATGDVAREGNAQDRSNLNGKILRLNLEGSIPKDNPILDSYVWSSGLRNVQGLVLAPNGNAYASEHGDAIEDEINLILPHGNYGWDRIEGMHDQGYEERYALEKQAIEPIYAWTPTVAPAGIDYYSSGKIPEWTNSLLLTTLKGKSIRVLKLDKQGRNIVNEEIYLEGVYGRIRDLCISPDGSIYFSTSNRDWNPMTEPGEKDDRILRISRVKKAEKVPLLAKDKAEEASLQATGEVLYQKYCLACHKSNGKGLEGTFPSLVQSGIVEDSGQLIPLVLRGVQSDIAMPSFSFLSDEEIAKLLNYVGDSFGEKRDTIRVSQIKQYR